LFTGFAPNTVSGAPRGARGWMARNLGMD